MNIRFASIATSVALGSGAAAFAGISITINDENAKVHSIISIEGNKLRIDRDGGADRSSTVIFDGDAQKLITVDSKRKTYSEATPQQMQSIQAQANGQMNEAMAKITPDPRKQIDHIQAQAKGQIDEAMAKITPDPRKQIDQLQAQAKGQMDEAMAKITPEPRKQIDQLQAQAKGQMDEAMTKMTPDQRKQMAQMMAKLNPEQRKQMEAMMSGHGNAASLGAKKEQGPQLKWEPVGGSQQIAGFPCHGFKLMRDGKTSAEGCYISWDAGAIAKSDLAPMKKMGEFFPSAAGANAGDLIGQQLDQWDKLPGFPAIWKGVSVDGKHESKQTLTGIRRGSISADKFQPPSGYKLDKAWDH